MPRTKIFLIPNLLGENAPVDASIPPANISHISEIRHFAVEHLKDARRLLVKLGLKSIIDESSFFEIHKNSEADVYAELLQVAKSGKNIGIISDAGCPGIADPGAELIRLAHQNKIQVVPLVGPSSILLAIMASGFSGQSFAFHGYLERDKAKRPSAIRQLETNAEKLGQTQVFMETPYRNEALFEDLLKHLKGHTLLSIACDISLPSEHIQTKTVAEWKKDPSIKLAKRPAIFSLFC